MISQNFKNLYLKKPKNKLWLLWQWLTQVYSYIYPMAKRWKHSFNGGIFPQYHKELSTSHPLKTPFIPDELILPLQQHIGIAIIPLVKVGDLVQKNQCIANTKKGLHAPIHAPTSGTIIAIEDRITPHISGLATLCIILKPDCKDTSLTNALDVSGKTPNSAKELKDIIYRAGIVGMGGAGFPTFAKIPNEPNKVHTLLINGAECEPFISCDDILMQTKATEIVQGALIVAKALGSTNILCGIENNKLQAIKAMKKAAKKTPIEIKVVATVYPMGGQKQLTQELTGLEIPPHLHAEDTGILLMNVATYEAIYQAVKYGNPLTQRLVTVSGFGLNAPYNIQAMFGTSFNSLAQQASPKIPLNYPLIMGGPMMGTKVPSNLVPVLKTTNCILANPPEPVEKPMPCIRCGECMDACPVNLLPQQMYWHSRSEEFDKVENLNVFDCIECGCCSFVCPSNIPLVQYYRHSKSAIKQLKREENTIKLAKQRHEARLLRLEKEKTVRAERIKAKKAAVKKPAANKPAPKKSSAAAAAARAAAIRASAKKSTVNSSGSTDPKPKVLSARDKAIAKARKMQQDKTKTDSASSTQAVKLTDDKENKRKKAMEAAKKMATARKAAKDSQEDKT